MDHIEYFKLQSKNLLKDFKSRTFNEKEQKYLYKPLFFDISAIFEDFGFPDEKEDFSFTLMNAQHVISKLAGFNNWKDLISSSSDDLITSHRQFDKSGYKITRNNQLLPAPQNPYALILPNGVFGINVEFSFDSVEYAESYMVYYSDNDDISTAKPLAEGMFSPIKYTYRGNRKTHKYYWVRAYDGEEYGEWSDIAGRNRK
ncbi:MAG: hypothetical protein IK002_06235 [Treponema sp.]|uniref:hypothetical protein n=1 Tax=Treponema sp. TaxID=166 RepID=UPI00298DC827|nr:hypothetical protein [Treponema sp.]MBR5933571.1 hypothetical protein [Treponema sp.]